MAHTKAGGSAKNLNDSNPKYLGVKLADGQKASTAGVIILRQRGMKYEAGKNVLIGKDHTLFAKLPGTVKFTEMRKTSFNGSTRIKKVVNVV